MAQRICSMGGCSRPHRSRGLCNRHYQRWLVHGDPAHRSPTREERFWANAERCGPDECWPWKGPRLPNGYGIGRGPSGRKTTAHRAAWEYVNGPVSGDMHVCHRCDNRPCVNPAHLFLGTRQDNMDDMVAKGRSTRGESQHASLLTEAEVREIRQLAGSMSQREIGRQFGVTQGCICAIVNRRTWRHV